MNILVTGGTGFIGSHTLVELYQAGHRAVVVDNLCNSSQQVLGRVERLLGLAEGEIPFYEVDICDEQGLERMLERHSVDACIHFAGLKAVGESVEKPWLYYSNNIGGTLTLLKVMERHGCKNMVFSSSATVYGEAAAMPLVEDCPKGQCTNPYGWTKSMIEQVLTDVQRADAEWNIVLLRYFNPVGAHPSGLIGENPRGVPNNLMPYITQVAAGQRRELCIFGSDYPTPDGTGVRDYIHVCDLALSHIAALGAVARRCGLEVYNIGTGKGYSVLEMVQTFERVNGVKVPYRIGERRAGDVAECWCDPSKARRELGWQAKLGLEDMVRDSWHWQQSCGMP
ncbi:MAG: UDP-glucose 4-epimerase GalE [Bacteroidales bacterium]|nr:UDP-glucose 4-epimerase GalE [Bacteroidales bacterium]